MTVLAKKRLRSGYKIVTSTVKLDSMIFTISNSTVIKELLQYNQILFILLLSLWIDTLLYSENKINCARRCNKHPIFNLNFLTAVVKTQGLFSSVSKLIGEFDNKSYSQMCICLINFDL